MTFEVIGVATPRMQEGDNDNNRVIYIPYNSMDVLKDNHYLDGIWLDSAGLDHDKLEQDDSRDPGYRPQLQARRSARGLRLRRAEATGAVRHHHAWP